jgi:CO/xanthine dehydrogenase FAD-binding subunit
VASYLRPRSLESALSELGRRELIVVAGATDHYPSRVGTSPDEDVLDITAIEGLRAIQSDEAGWTIPALATWTDVLRADLPALFDGLKAAARTIGGTQIQNRGTVAGNVCNASPAADGVPPLMALDAAVELRSAAGPRLVPIEHFVTGNRTTLRRPGELVTAIRVPRPPGDVRSAFLKLGSRSSLVISIVMAAAIVGTDADGRIEHAAVAVGACSPVARRLRTLESRLVGRSLDGMAEELRASDLEGLSPIDDIRGSADYRRDAAHTLVRRLLEELAT